LVLLLLDFEKAYDRISCPFMRRVLEKRGFNPEFTRGVISLYDNPSSAVIINGQVWEEFDLERSVKQGCPMAPFLFIVVFDALGFMLEDPKWHRDHTWLLFSKGLKQENHPH